MKYESDYKWGQSIYIKNDPEQTEYRLNRVFLAPKGYVSLELFDAASGDVFEVWEFHTSKEIDKLKLAGVDKKDDDGGEDSP